ncbi:MAG TPA: HEAT repeat domain-containing protein [Bryobacteraceae bacterium]|jgi:HEAT repeat protein|nr:HEAT repeat domain-containing protein [Bryobacteraceae bacterium]
MRTQIGVIALSLAALPPVYAQQADPRAWQVLNDSLHSGDSDHRRQALAALGTIDGENMRAVKAGEEALRDKSSLVRQSAALALGEMKARDAVPALKGALDDSGEVAFAAAKALTEIGDSSGRDVLITVLAGERKDISPGLMTNALRKGKSKLNNPGGLVLMGAQDATGAMFGPASFVFPAVKDTLDLKGKGAPGRAAAAAYLARDPDPYAISLLEWALNDDNQFVRLEAARGLAERGNAGSIAKLEPLLDDQHNVVRDVAAAAIICINDRGGAAGEPSEGPVNPVTSKKVEKAHP